MSTERNLDKMGEGQRAAAVMSAIDEVLAEQIHNKTVLLISHYRGGVINHDYILGAIAEISALDSLRSTLESRYRQGISAAQRELGHAAQE